MDYTGQWLIQVRKGVAELLVLRIVATRGEIHGYAIVKELLAVGPVVAGESTVYPVLKRLEADGMLVSRWVASEAGPPRKYYALSPDGTGFLAEAQHEWDSLVQSVDRLTKEDSHE
jgi:PadR family transcriptional regulator, regulatory protein PadR